MLGKELAVYFNGDIEKTREFLDDVRDYLNNNSLDKACELCTENCIEFHDIIKYL